MSPSIAAIVVAQYAPHCALFVTSNQTRHRKGTTGSTMTAAISEVLLRPIPQNTIQATHAGLKTSNCVIVGEPGKVIGTIGISDLLIIQDGDCVLVAHRSDEGTVKDLVEELRKRGLGMYL